MHEYRLTLPELGLIGGTRAALGAGIGLLLANRLNHDQRTAAGWALVVFGALTTIPLAIEVLGKSDAGLKSDRDSPSRSRRDQGAAVMHTG